MRIAFDVSPLVSPTAGDRELHPGLARWSRGGRGRWARDRGVRADEHPRPRAYSRCARRDRRRGEDLAAPVLARGADCVELARSSGRRTSRRRGRRAPFLRLDVPATAGRSTSDDDPRPRAVASSRVDDRQDEVDARPQVSKRRCVVRHRLREFGATRDGTSSRRSVSRLSGSASRARRRRPCTAPTGLQPTSEGRTC